MIILSIIPLPLIKILILGQRKLNIKQRCICTATTVKCFVLRLAQECKEVIITVQIATCESLMSSQFILNRKEKI